MNTLESSAGPPPLVVEAFTSAAITALQELTQIEAFAQQAPAVANLDSSQVVAATVRLMRPLPGTMTLVLAENSAAHLAARYLPPQTLLTDDLVDDVVGEMANVIAGQAKTVLKGTPYHFTMSTPVVTRAASSSQLPLVAEATLVASLNFAAGRLHLLVHLPPCPGA